MKVLKVTAHGYIALIDGTCFYVHSHDMSDKGCYGDALEIAVKIALGVKNAENVSPFGSCDFIDHLKHYDVKQNSTPIRYKGVSRMVKGSSRVLYATHVAHNVVKEYEKPAEDGTVRQWRDIAINLDDTELFVIDRDLFVKHLLENGYAKLNAQRGDINIQTLYNYKKNAYHGKKGRTLESWLRENENDSFDIVERIRQGYASL